MLPRPIDALCDASKFSRHGGSGIDSLTCELVLVFLQYISKTNVSVLLLMLSYTVATCKCELHNYYDFLMHFFMFWF
jgi:hypothetical protein